MCAADATPAGPDDTAASAGRHLSAIVPSVTGAPGDGSVALTSALQRELSRNGVSLTTLAGGQTYSVEGKVTVGEAKDGKQPITIDWHVKIRRGKSSAPCRRRTRSRKARSTAPGARRRCRPPRSRSGHPEAAAAAKASELM